MINNKKIVVVMPAYNAGLTLEKTYKQLPHDIIDEVVVVDDCSTDNTIVIAKSLGIKHILNHDVNKGYGANQKTCYEKSLELGADVIVMVHPDYQYEPKLVTAMASIISEDVFDCVLASRILGVGAIKGGMPVYKYISNRLLTAFQNILLGYKLSEYHTGYRAFSREIFESIPFNSNSDDFIFDNQILIQIIENKFNIGEITCPTKYFDDSSSINLSRSIKYGSLVVLHTINFRLNIIKRVISSIFVKEDK